MHEDSTNRKSKSQFSFSSLSPIVRIAPYAPTLRPVTEASIVDTRITQTFVPPSTTADNDRTIIVTKTTQPSLQDNGPPIVVITPPGSPRDRSYVYDEFELSTKLSDTSEGTRSSSKHRRRKALVVANPDSDSDSDRHASQRNRFVYAPPPLPETSFSVSNQLAPSRPSFPMHRRCHTEGGSVGARWHVDGLINSSPPPSSLSVSPPASGHSSSTANSGLSLFGKPSRPRIDTSIDTGVSDYTDGSDTDDDLHLWNKPPADLHESSRRKLTCASSPTLSRMGEVMPGRKRSSRVARTSTKTPRSAARQSWSTRPGLDDVYDHLQQFFPHHEVGQTFTQPRTSVLAPASRVENKGLVSSDAQASAMSSVQRSIRQQAEKPQSNLGQFYRMTKFWGAAEER
jgi:hypothetical protein